jgi:hypothetical protein
MTSNDNTTRAAAIRTYNTTWENLTRLAGSTETVLVARHERSLLTLSTVEDDLPALRSGYAIGVHAGGPLVDTSLTWTNNNLYQPLFNIAGNGVFTTGRTATLRIQENVPNALDLARGRDMMFELPEGVIVTGIEWRYYRGSDNLNGGTHWVTADIPEAQRGAAFQAFRPPLNMSQAVNNNTVIFHSDNQVILRPDLTMHPGEWALRNHTIRLEVRFFVSIPFGYEYNVSDELEVTVTGIGVNNLDENENTIAIAEVYDPVRISHSGDVVELQLVGRENDVYHAYAGAITITETAAARLQLGTRLQVGVVRYYNPGSFDLRISRGQVVVDETTGARLTVVDVSPPVVAGGQLQEFFTLEVTRESANDTPGAFNIDGLTLFGHVYRGERYFLVVTGPAIAENHWGVVSTAVAPFHRGVHLTNPWELEIINLTGAPGERANSIAGRTFNPATMVEGAPEMIWYRAPGMTFEGGFVGLRAFANVAGAEEISWNNANRTAFIAGWDWQGNWVTINMEQGSPTAQITRGTTRGASDLWAASVDIATFSDGRTGPAGTVIPIFRNDRIYVPFRFVFNAFGFSADYDIERDGNLVRVIAN